jgi:hypothetical protein
MGRHIYGLPVFPQLRGSYHDCAALPNVNISRSNRSALWGSPNRFEDEYRSEKQGLGCDVYLQDDSLVQVWGLQVLAADTPDVLEASRAD